MGVWRRAGDGVRRSRSEVEGGRTIAQVPVIR
jgi:hypothetical protein